LNLTIIAACDNFVNSLSKVNKAFVCALHNTKKLLDQVFTGRPIAQTVQLQDFGHLVTLQSPSLLLQLDVCIQHCDISIIW